MKSLTFFLRTAIAQFTTLLNVLIRALQIQRRAQLIAVLVVSILSGFLVARTVHSTRATQQQWTSQSFHLGHIAQPCRGRITH
jgi:membrane protein implicated in regulation of membrane protease activity